MNEHSPLKLTREQTSLSPSSKQLTGPSYEALDVCGQFTGQLQRNTMQTMQDVYVVRGLHEPLLEDQ